jgi:Xaa-Pro aminopeptidase
MSDRLKQLRLALKSRSLDGVIVSRLPHIRYISGFSGSAGVLVVTQKKATVVTDFRYMDQVAAELKTGFTSLIHTRNPYEEIITAGLLTPGMKVGFQDSAVSVAGYDAMRKMLRKVKLEKSGDMVAALVKVKSDEEVKSIRKAANIAAKVYAEVLKIAKPGVRENELAMEIGYLGRKFGSEGDAFDIIVASGPRGALPHGRASTKKIRKGEMVTLDFGCIVDGFNSDMTRTFSVGRPSDEARKIFDIVLESEQRGVRAARSGMSSRELDNVCRDHIVAAGYGANFGHGTGHGLGIEVHEAPSVSFKGVDEPLVPGMVVTIEPGIYLPGNCGVRIEDDVVITEKGCRVLTSAPRELIIV